MVGEVETLDAFEDRGAEIVLHVEREPAADEAAGVRQPEVHRAEAHQEREERPEGAVLLDDHVVDDRAFDERDQHRDERRAEGHPERDEHLALVPGEEWPEATDPAPAHARSRAARRCAAAFVERSVQLRQRRPDRIGVVDAREDVVEALAHRRLCREECGVPLGRDLQAERAAVVVDGRPGHQPVFDQGVDGGGDGGLGERQLTRDQARPLGAAGDHGEEAVLGQGDVGAGPLEHPGQPGEGEHVVVHESEVYQTVRATNYVRSASDSGPERVTSARQAGIHCGVTDP